MNHHIDPAKTGLAVGKTVGGLHLVWSIFVALGWAQALVNFSMWAHMVSIPIVIKDFEISAAITLIVVTSIIGCIVGYVFALLWNRMHRG